MPPAAYEQQLQFLEFLELLELIEYHQPGGGDPVEKRDGRHGGAVSGRGQQFQQQRQQLVRPALAEKLGEGPIAQTAQRSEQRAGSQPPQNRSVLVTIAALIIVLAAGATIVKSVSSTSSSAVVPGTRAVIVPTADAVRTVVIVPCGTGASVLSSNPAALMRTTGTTSLELPQGQGDRVVLVPPCSGGGGGAVGSSALPSSAFVPAAGTPLPAIGPPRSTSSPQAGAPDSAQFELTVAAGSPIRTIVVSPCQKARPSGPAEQILSAAGRSSTAVAPGC